MDPTQCLDELLQLLSFQLSEDREDIICHLIDLKEWIIGNGFYPIVNKYEYDHIYQIGE